MAALRFFFFSVKMRANKKMATAAHIQIMFCQISGSSRSTA